MADGLNNSNDNRGEKHMMKWGLSGLAFSRIAATALLGAGVSSASAPTAMAASAAGEPVKIGVLEDRSGPVVGSSQEEVKSLKAAVDAINSSRLFFAAPPVTSGQPGIMGRPIALLLEDTQADPNQALSKSRRLASSGAQAIIVTTTSPDTMQARLVCEEVKIICFAVSAGAPAIVKPPHNEYVFTQAPTFDVQGDQLIAALKARQYNPIAIVRDDSGPTKVQSDIFKKRFEAAGVQVSADEVVPKGTTELASQLLRVRESNPRAVLNLVNPPPEDAVFIRAFQAAKIGLPMFGMGAIVASPELWPMAGSAIDGTVAVDTLSPDNADANQYKEYFLSVYGKDSPFLSIHPMSLTALLLIKKAMEDAGATSGEAVKTAMEHIAKFPAGFGQPGYTITYSPEDHNGATAGSVVLVEFAGQRPAKMWSGYQPTFEK
jgi:branched-chain amino acid transport system substrate-binding protein